MSLEITVSGRRPKLIGTDLDGTIVANYGFISERTKIALAAAHKAGIHIYFVTGRPIRWMVEIKNNFDFREYASTYFGRVELRLQDPALPAWLEQV